MLQSPPFYLIFNAPPQPLLQVLYINGTAYLRRELEMPAAALHHAGIQGQKLEDLERRLQGDMLAEAAAWGGRVLLHREVAAPAAADVDAHVAAASPLPAPPSAGRTPGGGAGLPRYPAAGGSPFAAGAAQAAGECGVEGSDAAGGGGDDITKTTEYQPTTQVSAFWEVTADAGDIDAVSESCISVAEQAHKMLWAPCMLQHRPALPSLSSKHRGNLSA